MDQETVLKQLRESRLAIDSAYERRRELILVARELGVPVASIARELGLSRERVYKIIRNLR